MSITKKRDFAQLKSRLPIDIIIKILLPQGKQKGKEWVSINPTRADKKEGSFSVNLITGVWSDFATKESGADIIDLYAYINQISLIEAYDQLEKSYSHQVQIKTKKENRGELIHPIPDNAPPPPMDDRIQQYEYCSEDSEFLLLVARYKDKSFKPWTYRRMKNGECKWVPLGLDDKSKPIYRLSNLLKFKDKPVLIVEGEKTADFAQMILEDYVCVTWLGGSGSVKNIDLTHLKGRTIYLWPDNDKTGIQAMQWLKNKLPNAILIDVSKLGLRDKWDLADLYEEDCPINLAKVKELLQEEQKEFELMDKMTFPDLSPKFNPINTSENIEHLSNFYKLEIKFNSMTRKIECTAEGQNYSLQNKNDCFFTYLSNLCVRNGVPKIDLHNHLIFIADKHRYHPAIDWIESIHWDGINRIDEFLETIQSDNQEHSNKLIRRWMIGCIACLYEPNGVSLEGMLVIQGAPKIGKSYWFLNLVPANMRHLLIDGESINVAYRDDIRRVTGRWLCELAEIESTIKKSSVEDLKGFITRREDVYRVPFGRNDINYPRMTSFYGSVNNYQFLVDPTGNRRFWCITANYINYKHNLDMQQVWAQFKSLYDKGESYRLTDEEQNNVNDENELFVVKDPLEESLLNAFDWDSPFRNHPMSAMDVLKALGLTIDNYQIQTFSKKIGTLLVKINKRKPRKSNGRTVHDMPNRKLLNNHN